MDESKVNEHIVRITVLLKRWLSQIKEGHCMDAEDKKHPRIIRFGYKALYPFQYMGNCLNHLQKCDKNSWKSCPAGLYLLSVGLKQSEMEWQSLLNHKCFKKARTIINGVETLKTILEEQGKSICHNFWRYKVMASYENWDNVQGHLLKNSDQESISCLSWTKHSTI